MIIKRAIDILTSENGDDKSKIRIKEEYDEKLKDSLSLVG